MTFKVFAPGEIAKSRDFNNNFSTVFYSILYNRMENDQLGQTHLNNCIISDIFSDSNGCYNTINTSNTTSAYNNTNCEYSNLGLHCDDNYFSYCCVYCVIGCSYSSYTDIGCMGVEVSAAASGSYAYANVTKTSSGNTLCLCEHKYIAMCPQLCIHGDSHGYTSRACSSITLGNYSNSLYCNFGNGGATVCCNQYVEYCKSGTNCYDYYIDGVCQCSMSGDLEINSMIHACVYDSGGSATPNSSACSFVNMYTILNTNIITSTHKFDNTKCLIYFVSNSTIPDGACVTADIYNQDGCLYASDVAEGTITPLCASDSCCFYTKIKQNSPPNSDKITTKGYAILFE